jgi:hypothetical protein
VRRTSALQMVFGGTAVVCCPHDVEKRAITTESALYQIGREQNILYDPKQHKIHRCSCCENLFADVSDVPIYCNTCRKPPKFMLGGSLPEPEGVVG